MKVGLASALVDVDVGGAPGVVEVRGVTAEIEPAIPVRL